MIVTTKPNGIRVPCYVLPMNAYCCLWGAMPVLGYAAWDVVVAGGELGYGYWEWGMDTTMY